MSSSDTSDDEHAERLREALDTQLIHDDMFKGSNDSSQAVRTNPTGSTNPPSLRPNIDADDQFNMLGVTPQFQQHVAKRLSAILDAKLQANLAEKTSGVPRKRTKGGIKLFTNSTVMLKRIEQVRTHKQIAPKKLNEKQEDACENDNELKCSEVAVNPDDILQKKDVQNWSSRSKAKVFRYKKSKNGMLTSLDI